MKSTKETYRQLLSQAFGRNTHIGAADVPYIYPQNYRFPPLTKENALLLLEWICQVELHFPPNKFFDCVKSGSWLQLWERHEKNERKRSISICGESFFACRGKDLSGKREGRWDNSVTWEVVEKKSARLERPALKVSNGARVLSIANTNIPPPKNTIFFMGS